MMKSLTVLIILCICNFTLAFSVVDNGDRKVTVKSPTRKPPRRGMIVGGVTKMSEEDFEDPAFQAAINELIEKLNEANTCYIFEPLEVVEASTQVVSGIKYNVKLKVKPIFNGSFKSECFYSSYSNVGSTKEVESSIWSQPWLEEDPYKVAFKDAGVFGDFNRNGKMFLS
ncbi:hypothetical protein Aperf_G00000035703 [Anoplocephala perfoliata]